MAVTRILTRYCITITFIILFAPLTPLVVLLPDSSDTHGPAPAPGRGGAKERFSGPERPRFVGAPALPGPGGREADRGTSAAGALTGFYLNLIDGRILLDKED